MVETVTAHYGWTKPEVTKSASTWGGFLNGDLDSIDALVFANQQGIVPIGGIQMFGGTAAPANWLLCDGTSYVRTAPYDQLFAVLSTRFGAVDGSHFSVPNLTQKFPLGAGPNPVGQTGGSLSASIATANLPAHAHPIADVTHTHSVNQTPHLHGDPGHAHPINDPGHAHAIVGQVLSPQAGVNVASGSGWQFPAPSSVVTDSRGTGIVIQPAGANLQSANANVSLIAGGTNLSTTQNTGSGTPLSVVPPFVAVYFIVRYV